MPGDKSSYDRRDSCLLVWHVNMVVSRNGILEAKDLRSAWRGDGGVNGMVCDLGVVEN